MPSKHLKEVAVTWLLQVDRFFCCGFDFLCRHCDVAMEPAHCPLIFVFVQLLSSAAVSSDVCVISLSLMVLCYQMELPRRRGFWWETTSSPSTGLTSPASLTLRLLTWLDRVRCFIRVTLACNKVFHFSTVLMYLALNTTHQCPKRILIFGEKKEVVFVIM